MTRFLKDNTAYFALLTLFLIVGILFYLNMSKGDLILFFSENRHPVSNSIVRFTNLWGEGYAYLIIGITLLFYKLRNALMIALTGITALFCSQLLKDFFGHPRPSIFFSEIQGQPDALMPVPDVELVSSYTSSFPSGHTMAAFALYGLLAFSIKQQGLKIVFLLIATIAGISRIYLGQHFLEDVLAGACFGTLIAATMFPLQEWIGRKFIYTNQNIQSVLRQQKTQQDT